ncbi:hypothetical protein Hanom_Chr08g00720511 [Helianthus anomalus]
MKEAYDKMSSKTKQFIDVSRVNDATIRILKGTMMYKQNATNEHFDTTALLKQELITKIVTESVNKKLISYTTSSYVLDHIFQKPIKESESEEKIVENRKESGYHQVLPRITESYCRKNFEGVKKALDINLKSVQNQIDQLPDDIDVIYTKSDVCESELVNDVVEKVFD